MIETLVDASLMELELLLEFLPRLSMATIAAIIIYLIGKGISKTVVAVLRRSSIPETHYFFFKKLVTGIAAFIAVVVFLNLIGYSTLAASLVAGGGLTAVMFGFAFKDIGENFLAGFFLAFSRPFNTDDVIESDGILGRVKSIQLRHTHIRTIDGCDVFVPSAQLFTKPLHNYTLDGLRRGSFTVGIDYADKSDKALDVILNTLRDTNGVLKKPGPAVSLKGFSPDFVELHAFFWINAKDQELTLAKVRTQAMDRCRKALLENGFTFSSDVSTALEMQPLKIKLDKEN